MTNHREHSEHRKMGHESNSLVFSASSVISVVVNDVIVFVEGRA